MTKKELLARIEELERRVALLEAPNIPTTWTTPTISPPPAMPYWDVLPRGSGVWCVGNFTGTGV